MKIENQSGIYENQFCICENQSCSYENQFCIYEILFCTNGDISILQKKSTAISTDF